MFFLFFFWLLFCFLCVCYFPCIRFRSKWKQKQKNSRSSHNSVLVCLPVFIHQRVRVSRQQVVCVTGGWCSGGGAAGGGGVSGARGLSGGLWCRVRDRRWCVLAELSAQVYFHFFFSSSSLGLYLFSTRVQRRARSGTVDSSLSRRTCFSGTSIKTEPITPKRSQVNNNKIKKHWIYDFSFSLLFSFPPLPLLSNIPSGDAFLLLPSNFSSHMAPQFTVFSPGTRVVAVILFAVIFLRPVTCHRGWLSSTQCIKTPQWSQWASAVTFFLLLSVLRFAAVALPPICCGM